MEHPSLVSSPVALAQTLRTFGEADQVNKWQVKTNVSPTQSTNAHGHRAIDRVPPELLANVFLVCAAVWPTRDKHDYFIQERVQSDFRCGDCLPWIPVAQVCRYWRYVALACGELWRELLFSCPEATNEMLRRSNGVTLVVKAEDSSYSLSDVYENVRLVLPDIRRVSVLHLCFPRHLLQPLLCDISVGSQSFESLRLRTPQDDFEVALPFDMPDIVFTNSLRILELSNCKFSWQSVLPSGLTHLELRRITTPPTMTQILSLLRGVPTLNTLILDQALPASPRHVTSSDVAFQRQFLPHLRAITLVGNVDSCTNVLEQIVYPIATIATFECKTSSRESPNFHRFLQAARSAVRYGGGHHIIQSFLIATTYHPRCILRCLEVYPSSILFDSPQDVPQLSVTFSAKDDFRTPFATTVIRAALVTLPLSEVQSLCVGVTESDIDIDWSGFLQYLPKLQTIRFLKGVPAELIKLLTGGKSRSMGPAVPEPCLLPHLRSLWLTGADFRRRVHESEQSLLTFLRWRSQLGLAIHDLHLKDCWYLYQHVVEEMKEHVRDVDWDEVEQEEEEYPECGRDFEGIDNSD